MCAVLCLFVHNFRPLGVLNQSLNVWPLHTMQFLRISFIAVVWKGRERYEMLWNAIVMDKFQHYDGVRGISVCSQVRVRVHLYMCMYVGACFWMSAMLIQISVWMLDNTGAFVSVYVCGCVCVIRWMPAAYFGWTIENAHKFSTFGNTRGRSHKLRTF